MNIFATYFANISPAVTFLNLKWDQRILFLSDLVRTITPTSVLL